MCVLQFVSYALDAYFLSSAPSLFQKYENASTPAVDEWTLSQNMAADTASGGLNQLENHYSTFIVSSHPPRENCILTFIFRRLRRISRRLLVLGSISCESL